jgi:pimeloyl-ACP methyl ester carboxylesterase
MAARSTYMICTRDIDKKGRFRPEPGATTFLRVPASASTYTPDNGISKASWRRSVSRLATGEFDPVTGMEGDVLVFVHGYNNDRAIALWRTRTLQETLAEQGWKGVVVGFDWPSDNNTLNYLEDRSDAADVALRLVQESLELLIDAQDPRDSDQPPCKLNVHLLGHSTGAYVIMEAFLQAQKVGAYYKRPWRLAQVAFIAGDVSSRSLEASRDKSGAMYDRIMRLTNYSNRYDKVLGVSNAKRLGTSPRAGRVGLPEDTSHKAVNVDCSDYFLSKDPASSRFEGTFNHSWHIGDPVFALDLAMTLEGGIDRTGITTRQMTAEGLVLQADGRRPAFQDLWDLEAPPVPV